MYCRVAVFGLMFLSPTFSLVAGTDLRSLDSGVRF